MEKIMFRVRTRTRGLVVLMFLLLAGGTACNKPSYIELDPSYLEMGWRGETRRITGRAMNHQGRYFPEVMFQWESENPEIATVDAQGNVEAVSSGRTYVIARTKELEARTRVIVNFIERLEVPEKEVTLSLAERTRYVPEARPVDRAGRHLVGRRITVRSRDTEIVSVDQRGGIHPRNPGEAEVVIEADGISQVIQVTVTR